MALFVGGWWAVGVVGRLRMMVMVGGRWTVVVVREMVDIGCRWMVDDVVVWCCGVDWWMVFVVCGLVESVCDWSPVDDGCGWWTVNGGLCIGVVVAVAVSTPTRVNLYGDLCKQISRSANLHMYI